MTYWNDEDYYEPTEAEALLGEYTIKMIGSLKTSVKDKLDRTVRENTQLKEDNARLQKLVQDTRRELDAHERNAVGLRRSIEADVRSMAASKILQDFRETVYTVTLTYHMLPKCNMCDHERKIRFTSPQGNNLSEKCRCSNKIRMYEPREGELYKFRISNGPRISYSTYLDKSNGGRESFFDLNRTNVLWNGKDPFQYSDRNKLYFDNHSDCLMLCDWLNKNHNTNPT